MGTVDTPTPLPSALGVALISVVVCCVACGGTSAFGGFWIAPLGLTVRVVVVVCPGCDD